MSYFAQHFAAHDGTQVHDQEHDVEIADGVVVERRSVLLLSAGAVASLLFGGARLRAQEPQPKAAPPSEGLSFEQFMNEALPLARRLVDSKGKDEEAYLLTLAAALSRLQDPNAPIRDAMREFSRNNKREGERFPLAAVAMRLEPGKGFSHHDHLDYDGVIMGLQGEVRIRNYDPVGTLPTIDSTDTFSIRKTRDDVILPGRFSTLGRERENIHDLVAGKEGARVLDVFTFFTSDATSRYLDVEATARDAEAGIYDATWRQPKRR